MTLPPAQPHSQNLCCFCSVLLPCPRAGCPSTNNSSVSMARLFLVFCLHGLTSNTVVVAAVLSTCVHYLHRLNKNNSEGITMSWCLARQLLDLNTNTFSFPSVSVPMARSPPPHLPPHFSPSQMYLARSGPCVCNNWKRPLLSNSTITMCDARRRRDPFGRLCSKVR